MYCRWFHGHQKPFHWFLRQRLGYVLWGRLIYRKPSDLPPNYQHFDGKVFIISNTRIGLPLYVLFLLWNIYICCLIVKINNYYSASKRTRQLICLNIFTKKKAECQMPQHRFRKIVFKMMTHNSAAAASSKISRLDDVAGALTTRPVTGYNHLENGIYLHLSP